METLKIIQWILGVAVGGLIAITMWEGIVNGALASWS